MCYEPRNEEFAKVCRERDELKAAYDGAKLAMKALNEKLVQVTAERDALEKIVGESSFNCDYCKHIGVLQGCGFGRVGCVGCPMAECVCGKCKSGSMFEYRGVEDKT